MEKKEYDWPNEAIKAYNKIGKNLDEANNGMEELFDALEKEFKKTKCQKKKK